MTSVRSIFLDAQRKELLDKIPVFPRFKVDEPNWTWIDSDAQRDILQHIPEGDYEVFKFLLLHGCRPSEVRALKVKDIDIKNKSIIIRRTFSLTSLREKTKQGRTNLIPIHNQCVDYLKNVISRSLPEAFVFVNPRTGRPYSEHVFRRKWYIACKKAGVSKILLYSASRHSFASQLVNDNTPLEVVSKLLGHTNVKMTQKYAHVNLESQRTAIHKLSVDCPSLKNKNKKILIKQ